MNINPRYLCYSRAHGEPDPVRMLERDREQYPGGCMAGFLLWMSQERRAFFAVHPGAFMHRIGSECPDINYLWDYAAWDAWLQERSQHVAPSVD